MKVVWLRPDEVATQVDPASPQVSSGLLKNAAIRCLRTSSREYFFLYFFVLIKSKLNANEA
jgi:hypothetical protein